MLMFQEKLAPPGPVASVPLIEPTDVLTALRTVESLAKEKHFG